MPAPSNIPTYLDLDRIVEILRDQHHIENAYVEQTGGGVATIYAGPTRVDDDGATRYAAIAGPGSYGWGVRKSTADLAEFYVGPDDQGEADPVEPVTLGAYTEEAIASVIAAQARKSTPVPLSADEIEALGLDSTGRSLPPELAAARAEAQVRIDAHNATNRRLIAEGVTQWADRQPICEAAGEAAVEAYRRR